MNAIRHDWTKITVVGWWLALALLAYGLLSPQAPKVNEALLPKELNFWAAKGVHLGAFAFLAAVAGLLAISPRRLTILWVTLVAFAPLSEYLQTFVEGRYGCVQDVVIDLSGFTLGAGLALALRAASSARSRNTTAATTQST